MKISQGQEVWIKYYDGKAYRGTVVKSWICEIEGHLVTILTDACGYRTVKKEMCSNTKPTRKELQLR